MISKDQMIAEMKKNLAFHLAEAEKWRNTLKGLTGFTRISVKQALTPMRSKSARPHLQERILEIVKEKGPILGKDIVKCFNDVPQGTISSQISSLKILGKISQAGPKKPYSIK